ncbi:RNA polymerase II-associated protein 3 [Rhizophlyctis rosea]|uniref:RNA polymerase II-associated protein 3 n=1 Tax=Rhizophlyctis rosea TaxID=64517 RepID=A0AAD5X369_9FUNG|nr:RNA polymerase II-associated protein 3 [Rhizophlyctis rosea]
MASNIALQVRQNAEEYNSFLSDLKSWEKDIKAKDKAAKETPAKSVALPPVRGGGTLSSSGPTPAETSNEKESPKPKIKAYDYSAWDKFDVDKALEEIETRPASSSNGPDASIAGGGMAGAVEDPAEALEKSLIEKEKGNAHFKKGDYKKAVICYTKSMRHDPNNTVVPVNRAMAYLKLGKYEEAEADCTLGLTLDKKNVKALWRRGIARKELGKLAEAGKGAYVRFQDHMHVAILTEKSDLEQASVLEPSNKAVKEELQKVYAAARPKDDAKTTTINTTPTDSKTTPAASKPVRRRLNIEVVGTPKSRLSEIPPVSATPTTRMVESPSPPQPSPSTRQQQLTHAAANAAKTRSLADAKPAESSPKPAPAPSIAPSAGVKKSSSQLSISFERSGASRPVPKAMYEFERDWKSMRGNDEAIYEYMKNIHPAEYSRILKNSLESHYVSKMITILQSFYLRDENYDDVYEILLNLSRVQRFDMVIMFLSKAEKAGLADIIGRLRAVDSSQARFMMDDVNRLSELYRL